VIAAALLALLLFWVTPAVTRTHDAETAIDEGLSGWGSSLEEEAGSPGGAGVGVFAERFSSEDPHPESLSVNCPLQVQGRLEGTQENALGWSWTFRSEVEVNTLVPDLLAQMEQDGWELDTWLALDVSGNAWGCVAKRLEEGEVLMMYVAPSVLGESGDSLVTVMLMQASAVEEESW